MITLLILGVLAAVALPSFNGAIRKSRRSEAMSALSAVQQAQERWRANNSSYATNTQLTLPVVPSVPSDPRGLGFATGTSSGYYTLAIDASGTIDYTITATAVSGKSQSKDAGCQVLGLKLVAGGELRYGAAPTTIDWTLANPDPQRCWAR